VSAWPTVRLGDICEKITDGTHHSPANGPTGDFMYVTAKNIKPWGLDLGDITYIDARTHREIYSRCDVRTNDVLYVKDGATTGRVALNTLTEQFSLLSSVGVLRPGRGIKPKYLLYALQVPSVLDRMLDDMAGVAITRLTIRKLKDATIPLAPFALQDEIVADIEKQFSRLDEAVANLQRVKANLKRYKASVLKAAVEGRLVPTEAELARQEGRSYESSEQLLQRILEARRAEWKGRGKYEDLVSPGDCQLTELPEGWSVATVQQITSLVEYGSSAKTSEDSSGVPVLRMGNIVEGALVFEELKYLPAHHDEFPKLFVQVGDLLFNRTNSPELVGKTAVFKISNAPFSFASYLIRVRTIEGVNPEFLAAYINSLYGRQWVKAVVTQQVGQANVNGTKLQALVVPLPPLAEQHRIVAEVDRCLSLVREVETEVDTNVKRALALRQATLTRIFAGT
jgi:type I restriction enzyme, S subunit